jgi:methionyl-tRNA synthetase
MEKIKNSKNFYITTTLPYINSDLHLGHAIEFIRADVVARFKRIQGFEVFFNTGTDEHGLKILKKAEEKGVTAQAYADSFVPNFQNFIKTLGMLSDVHVVRTTDPAHMKAAQDFWKLCEKAGDIYKKAYKVKYCVGCELEKTDSELVDGKCAVHPQLSLEFIEEENYFFRFSKYQKPLLDLYKKNPKIVVPESRLNEIRAFVERGLEDFSISRLASKMSWGVEVPGDDKQVMYVWFDALVNYISTLGWPQNSEQFEKFWLNGTPVQYCGKDNLRQQSAMWQAMLLSAGLPTTHTIVIDGFVTGAGGVKMSKSLGNVVNPGDIVAEYGIDALRYFVLREISAFEDSPFTIEQFKQSYNANLANGLGNLVSRVLKMATSYEISFDALPDLDDKLVASVSKHVESFELNKALDEIWKTISMYDGFIQKNEPYKKIKVDKEGAHADIRFLLAGLFSIANVLKPFLPNTSESILECLKNKKSPDKPLFMRKD